MSATRAQGHAVLLAFTCELPPQRLQQVVGAMEEEVRRIDDDIVVSLHSRSLRLVGPFDGRGGRELVDASLSICLRHLEQSLLNRERDCCAPQFYDVVPLPTRTFAPSRRGSLLRARTSGGAGLSAPQRGAEGTLPETVATPEDVPPPISPTCPDPKHCRNPHP